MAEPIDVLFGLWTLVDRRKHKFNCVRQLAAMCPWCDLENTIEVSICCGDAALCQITLTIY